MPTYDLQVMPAASTGPNTGTIAFGYGSQTRSLTGAEKLAQQFFICLLSSSGSAIDDPTYGTSLGATLGGSNATNDAAIAEAVQNAITQAVAWFRRNQPTGLPASERLGGAAMSSFSRGADGATISAQIAISTLAGGVLQITGPLTTT